MRLDVRLPIGLMFTFLGAMLFIYGYVTPNAAYGASLGIDVNLWWGLVMLVFGLVMLSFALRARARARRPAPPSQQKA
ncbi:MAG: hypothetical protein KGN74_05415 [Gemmatimonadota bacterium]|nr:hypothetical protein [Gemmatimonadota bacterium]